MHHPVARLPHEQRLFAQRLQNQTVAAKKDIVDAFSLELGVDPHADPFQELPSLLFGAPLEPRLAAAPLLVVGMDVSGALLAMLPFCSLEHRGDVRSPRDQYQGDAVRIAQHVAQRRRFRSSLECALVVHGKGRHDHMQGCCRIEHGNAGFVSPYLALHGLVLQGRRDFGEPGVHPRWRLHRFGSEVDGDELAGRLVQLIEKPLKSCPARAGALHRACR